MNKPTCKLTGENGNIYNLLVKASRTLRENQLYDESDKLVQRIIGGEAQSYDEALRIITEYVDVV